MEEQPMKRIVVAFDEESIKYAKRFGLNKAFDKSKEKNCTHWDINEFLFDTESEANAFIKGVKAVHTLDEPFINIVRKSSSKVKHLKTQSV